MPIIPVEGNPAALAIVQTLKTGEHPERVTPLIAPPPFDAASYAQNPDAYLAESIPGRVFQTAQPGQGTTALRRVTPLSLEVRQNQPIELVVRAVPGAPVSFNTFDCGLFQNGLAAITVRADEDGFARATYTATTGVHDQVSILAGSPMTSGQVRFLVTVNLDS